MIGQNNITTADNAYAIGLGLNATGQQYVIGQYNKAVSNTAAFIVGTGTNDSDRKNAMWLTRLGNLTLAGSKLTFNGNGSPTAFTADDLTNTAKTATEAKNATETIKKTYLPRSGGYVTGSLDFVDDDKSSRITGSYIEVTDNTAQSTMTVYADRIRRNTFGGGWEFEGITDSKGTSSR